jgi:hypothetical protein
VGLIGERMDERKLLDGREFDIDGEVWTATVANDPAVDANASDWRRVLLLFQMKGEAREGRRLDLRLSHALLNDPTRDYIRGLLWRVQVWLSAAEESGRLEVL